MDLGWNMDIEYGYGRKWYQTILQSLLCINIVKKRRRNSDQGKWIMQWIDDRYCQEQT